jgi:hypothetical protein
LCPLVKGRHYIKAKKKNNTTVATHKKARIKNPVPVIPA